MTQAAQEYLNRRGSILWIPSESEPFDSARTVRCAGQIVAAAKHVVVDVDAVA